MAIHDVIHHGYDARRTCTYANRPWNGFFSPVGKKLAALYFTVEEIYDQTPDLKVRRKTDYLISTGPFFLIFQIKNGRISIPPARVRFTSGLSPNPA